MEHALFCLAALLVLYYLGAGWRSARLAESDYEKSPTWAPELELTREFRERILASFRRLSLPEGFRMPVYRYRKKGLNACADADSYSVTFAETIIAHASDEILDAMHAHELAHLEWDTRHCASKRKCPHYEIDFRAAEFCNSASLLRFLEFLLEHRTSRLYPWFGKADLPERILLMKKFYKAAA